MNTHTLAYCAHTDVQELWQTIYHSSGSTTQAMQSQGQVGVQVLEKLSSLTDSLSHQFFPQWLDHTSYKRRVMMYLDETAVLWAQSETLEDSHDWKEILERQGSTPLGCTLFSSPQKFIRSDFRYFYMDHSYLPFSSAIADACSLCKNTCFHARQSSFEYHETFMLLTEVFLMLPKTSNL
jgi:chorismate-pyruvate lyase